MKPTREQILAEPAGRQMDAWVAEWVMEYKKIDCPRSVWFANEKYKELEQTVFFVNTVNGISIAYKTGYRRWHPSTDIAAAWQVVEKFDSYDLDKNPSYPKDHIYGCRLVRYKPEAFARGHADTAPLAICRAALLAVTGDEL